VKSSSAQPHSRRAGKKFVAAKATKVRKRTKITEAIRAKVKKLLEQGKTGVIIAQVVGISLPGVPK